MTELREVAFAQDKGEPILGFSEDRIDTMVKTNKTTIIKEVDEETYKTLTKTPRNVLKDLLNKIL